MREGGSLTTLAGDLKVLAKDVRTLVESENYRERLVQCLLNPYDEGLLAGFLVLDNVCRDIRLLVGAEDTTALWEAREQTFGEAWDAVVADTLLEVLNASTDLGDQRRLRGVLLNALSKRTPDAVHEQIEVGLK